MKTATKVLTITAAALLSFGSMQAQDMHFSQFYMSPLNQNPAMAGAAFDVEATLNYKEQWKSIGTPFKTIGASYNARLNKRRMVKGIWGGGVNVFSDKAGDSQMGTTNMHAATAYHWFLNSYHTLGIGVSGGFGQRSIKYDALQWGNQYDGSSYNPALGSGEVGGLAAFGFGDFGAGIVWGYNNPTGYKQVTDNHDHKFNLGASIYHGHRPGLSFYNDKNVKVHAKYVLHGNGVFSVKNSNLAWVPGFFVYMQGPATQYYAGLMARYKLTQDSKFTGFQKGSAISIGGYMRARDAFVAATMLEFSHFAIGLSYDVTTSKLVTANTGRGGLELALRYVTPNPFVKRKTSKAMF